jgi:hypothetical protein
MKILFLDIDGVLAVSIREHDEYGSLFHPHFEDNLKYIIDSTDCKIVISSTWRMNGILSLQEMWKYRNLAGEIFDITPNHMLRTGSTLQRGNEIQEWLDLNKDIVSSYCIVDDDYVDINKDQLINFVRTSDNIDHPDCIDIGYGLTKICSEQIIKILNK